MAEESAAPVAKAGSPIKLVIVMIVGALLLVAVSMGGVFFLIKSMGLMNPGAGGAGGHGGHTAKEEKMPAIYQPLEPAFVVNFKDRGRTRFLQVEVQVMARDKKVIDELNKHMPVIRNDLLLLLSSQTAETLQTAEGKEALRQNALQSINKFMEEQSGKKDEIEALYFTSFVMQ